MSPLTQRNEFPVQPGRLMDRVSEFGAGGPGHVLSAPVECGRRWWVFCRGCGWTFSADQIDDVPARCDVERTLSDCRLTLEMVERISARERHELQKLLVRQPVSFL